MRLTAGFFTFLLLLGLACPICGSLPNSAGKRAKRDASGQPESTEQPDNRPDSPTTPHPVTYEGPGRREKSEEEIEAEERREEINRKKRAHPTYMVPPGEAFKALQNMGVKLKSQDKDLVKEYLSNASVLLFKLSENASEEVDGEALVDTLLSLGRSLIASLPDPDKNETHGKRSEYYEGLDLSMEIVKQQRENFTGYVFPPTNVTDNETDVTKLESRIQLPKQIFKHSTSEIVQILSLIFDPIPEMEDSAYETLYRINSKVISTSIVPPLEQDLDDAEEGVEITVKKEIEGVDSQDVCVFWDYELNNGSGGFSTAGCTLKSSDEMFVVCECRHLTEFTVLSEDKDEIASTIDTSLNNATEIPATTSLPPATTMNAAGLFQGSGLSILSCLLSAIFFASLIW